MGGGGGGGGKRGRVLIFSLTSLQCLITWFCLINCFCLVFEVAEFSHIGSYNVHYYLIKLFLEDKIWQS